MKEKIVYGFLALFLIALIGTPALYAEGDDSLISEEGSGPTFDGGAGTGAPEVVDDQDDTGESDPSAFEGDSESMPGERAPENLPMDDAPGVAGIGVE